MNTDLIFFGGEEALTRTLVFGVLAYAALIFFLRWSGNRTLSSMNTFDLIVNVSIGSVLASTLLIQAVSLAQGVLALAVLIALQFIVTWSSIRVPWLRRSITGEPQLLLKQGEFLSSALMSARVTEDEVRAAVRSAGLGDLGAVEAVVLETNGSFSVIKKDEGTGPSSLADVKHFSTADNRAA